MPRKTKKEKRLAQERRQRTFSDPNFKITIPKEVARNTEKSYSNATTQNTREEDTEDLKLKSYFFIDLKKSLVLVGSIIALEICLYFASINHYLPNLLK